MEALLEDTYWFLQVLFNLLFSKHGWRPDHEWGRLFSYRLLVLEKMTWALCYKLEAPAVRPEPPIKELSDDEARLLEAYRRMDEQWRRSWQVALGRLSLYQNSEGFRALPEKQRAEAGREFLAVTLLRMQGVEVSKDQRGRPRIDRAKLDDLLKSKGKMDRSLIEHYVQGLEVCHRP